MSITIWLGSARKRLLAKTREIMGIDEKALLRGRKHMDHRYSNPLIVTPNEPPPPVEAP